MSMVNFKILPQASVVSYIINCINKRDIFFYINPCEKSNFKTINRFLLFAFE